MADGRHLGFLFWAIISASINIFAPNLVNRWKIGSPRGPVLRNQVYQHFCTEFGTEIKSPAQGDPVLTNQIFENPRWWTAAILDFDFGP